MAAAAVDRLRCVVHQLTRFSADTELEPVISRLTLADMNRLIYRCDQEERDEGRQGAAYEVPNWGPLVYAGLQSESRRADTGRQARRGLQRESSRWGNENRNFNGMRKRYEQGRRAGLEAEAGRWPSGTDCA